MTTVYFVRHAESAHSIKDDAAADKRRLLSDAVNEDLQRPITSKGMQDRALVTDYLMDKGVQAVFASPAKRAVDTVQDFAQRAGLTVETISDLRERRVDSEWIADFDAFARRQWSDYDYKLSDGESLREVQQRNIAALSDILRRCDGKTVAIGTHGTALSTIINRYDPSYLYEAFCAMKTIMPWVVKMQFDGTECAGMQKIDLLHAGQSGALPRCDVTMHPIGELLAYRFVVIFVQVGDRWLYCRHRERDCWETAGGHIEQGETPLEAAKRELWEETGADINTLSEVCDYRVHLGSEYSNGRAFLARLNTVPIPPAEFEMSEVRLFDSIPDKMRFPHILPVLFRKVNGGTIV